VFGSLVKAMLPDQLKIERKDLKLCHHAVHGLKSFEAKRPEMGVDAIQRGLMC